jgi:hypothetical protein
MTTTSLRLSSPLRRLRRNIKYNWRQSVFVWTIWTTCTVTGFYVAVTCGRALPFSDDWSLVPIISGYDEISISWLWAQHNEHRIVIPKLVLVFMNRYSGADFRSVLLVNALLLSTVSALSIFVISQIRGRIAFVDGFFPLLFMHPGQAAFFWGFEFQFTSAAVLVCCISLILFYYGLTLSITAALVTGVCLILLPICGGNGLLHIPIVSIWISLRVLYVRDRHPNYAGEDNRDTIVCRRNPVSLILLASVIVAICISIAYFVGYHAISHPWPTPDIRQFVSAMLHVLSAGFGFASQEFWPIGGIATAIFVAGSFFQAGTIALDRRAPCLQRCRASDVCALIVAFMPVAAGVAYGRGGQPWQATSHYSTLALPILYWSFISWTSGTRRPLAHVVQVTVLLAMGIFWAMYMDVAIRYGRIQAIRTAEIERELQRGVLSDIIVDRYILDLFYIDVPEARKQVKEGIDDLRKTRMPHYGPE